MLSTAHHQLLPAVMRPKRKRAVVAAAGLKIGIEMVSLNASGLKSPLAVFELKRSSADHVIPPSNDTSRLAPCGASYCQLESKVSTAEYSAAPFNAMSGVLMKALYWPLAWARSSHSSGSAIIAAPIDLVNEVRPWSPAVEAHQSASANDQPAHSVTPSVASSPAPGTPLSSVLQPAGAVLVQMLVPARASS